jgi:CHASE2 domain-containing sensor protein
MWRAERSLPGPDNASQKNAESGKCSLSLRAPGGKFRGVPRPKDTQAKLKFRALGCLLAALIGLLLLALPDTALQDLSFDLPFRLRPDREVTNAVIVYFNQSCLTAVFQPNGILRPEAFSPPLRTNMPPDRRIYAGLLETLKKAGARLVFFDCNFNLPRPGEDEPFARAIRSNGPVILGGIYDSRFIQQTGGEAGIGGRPILPPNSTLKAAVTNWGILALDPSPSDHVARRLFAMNEQANAAILLAAQTSGFHGDAGQERWINYYGPAGSIDSVLLPDALRAENGSKFRDRAVFVGGDDPMEPDLHATPYSHAGSPGVEILATSYGNLAQSDWLERWNRWGQALLIGGWGVFAAAFLLCFRPLYSLLLTPVLMGLVLAAGVCAQWECHRWWCWAIPALAQTPFAGLWAAYANRWLPWPPVAVIGYRRHEGQGNVYADAIATALEHRGYGCARDVTVGLGAEDYRKAILSLIKRLPNFILILSQDSLDPGRINDEDDELRAEIHCAIVEQKHIIPVLIEDYKIPSKSDLPMDIRDIPRINAITRRHEDPAAAVDKIIRELHSRRLFKRSRNK